MTNREWLESLSDEDFAFFLGGCDFCVYKDIPQCFKTNTCVSGQVKWLKAEHKDEE